MVTKLADLAVYLVGGAVRDQLLGRKVVERDYMVVGASQQQMLDLGFQQVGKDFPVFLHPETKDEYALARTERKQGQGYTGFVCYAEPDVTLEQDLIRRDLTVNAMAQAPNGEIIDPYQGQQDLEKRLLRHVSPAFSEDPLRVLRVARFAARYHQYGFTIADETLALMTEIAASGELSALSAERVWKEIERALAEPNPEVFIETLRACGGLKVLWPELDKLWGIPNPAQHHPEICSGKHTILVLKQAVKLSADPKIRFAALCHDLGKGLTPEANWPKHHGHELAGVKVIEQVAARLKVPNGYKQLAIKVCQFHLHCHRALELKASTILKLFNQLDVWRKPQEFKDFLITCEADAKGRLGFEERAYPQANLLRLAVNKCSKVNAKKYVENGISGKLIKEAINNERVSIIQEIKKI